MHRNDHSNHLLLLVDDEEDIREVLQLPLEDLGYRVVTADSAETALTIFRVNSPAIVLTDIKMPGMDGIELLKQIKRERPDTEVIMITGHGDMDLAIKSLKYEAIDFVIKPIHVDTLEIALDRAEEKIRTRRQLQQYTQNLEKLIQEKAEIQDNLSSLGLLISSVTHGIKGLLTRLDGGIYLIDSGLAKSDLARVAEGRDALKNSALRIKKMVQDILYYAKERQLNKTDVDTASFVEEVIATVEPRLIDGAIELIVDTHKAPATLAIEPESLHSALISILDNAIDACAKDDAKNKHRVEFSVAQKDRHAVLIVRDNGIGMNQETRAKLFTVFFSTKGQSGTGLGLFIANKIISQHKGTITVESTPGSGSTFRIEIPAGALPNKQRQPATPRAEVCSAH